MEPLYQERPRSTLHYSTISRNGASSLALLPRAVTVARDADGEADILIPRLA